MKNITRIILAVIFFMVLAVGYEYYVYLWSQGQAGGAIIRVDIFMIYPVIIAISAGFYWLLGKITKKI
jgi:hypothetical protein